MRLRMIILTACILAPLLVFSQSQAARPRVLLIGVNGMEWDILRPLMLQGKLPNLASIIQSGTYGKLRTVSAPNCPRVYTTMFTSTRPEEHGVTGFLVGGITANTNISGRFSPKRASLLEWPMFQPPSPSCQ
jgi:predicted AlkP superfamily pyrophosphatase or phosphodiesterase